MLEDAPSSISVISKKEIRQLNIKTMGGVINIITKTTEKFNADATASYGTHGTRRYRLSIDNRFANKFSLRIGYERESTGGYKTTPVQKTIKSGTGILFGESHLVTVETFYRTDKSDTDDYQIPYYRRYSDRSGSTFYSGGKNKILGLENEQKFCAIYVDYFFPVPIG